MSEKDTLRGENGLRKDFLIEDWLVQPQLNRVTRGHDTVQVQPKIMAVLVCLADEAGQVVVREKLFKTVWADTYVTEHVLARSISVLRKIFDDKPQSPRVIETIPKVGYRLIAQVSSVTEEDPNVIEEVSDSGPESKSQVLPVMTPAVERKIPAPLISPRTLSWVIGLLGLLFFTFFVMGAGHRFHQ
jgi:DNA-binding winged helix-turn-helix (wHTH) protein